MREKIDFIHDKGRTLAHGDRAELWKFLNSSEVDPHWIVEMERRLDVGSYEC